MIKRLVKNLIFPITRIRPRLLILGTQKAGTTTLYEQLIAHPQIVPNRSWKEVRFFEMPERYREGFGWYLGNFPSRFEARGRMTLDASPGYLFFHDIPFLIRKDLGDDIKMIAILRNPAERAYSAWKMYHSWATNEGVHEVNRRIADRRTFTEAITQELNGRVSGQMYPYWYVRPRVVCRANRELSLSIR